MPGIIQTPTKEQALHLLNEWKKCDRIAEAYEAVANSLKTERYKYTAEVARREANDLLDQVLELMKGNLTN